MQNIASVCQGCEACEGVGIFKPFVILIQGAMMWSETILKHLVFFLNQQYKVYIMTFCLSWKMQGLMYFQLDGWNELHCLNTIYKFF